MNEWFISFPLLHPLMALFFEAARESHAKVK